MSQTDFDLVVIGAGPGGYVAAIRGAQEGLKTAIVEGHKMGGECLNYGCIPSKALITAGHLYHRIEDAATMGIEVQGLKMNLENLIGWKSKIVQQLTGGVSQLLKANGVTSFQGLGSFASKDGNKFRISINSSKDSYTGVESGSGKMQVITATNVIIATGSSTVEIPTLKFDGKNVLSSKEALDVTSIPKKLVVVGGGFIGLEIGSFFTKIGTQVTVVEATSGLLPGTDRDCVDVVQKRLTKKGVKFLFDTKALGAKAKGKGTVVEVQTPDGKKEELECDWALVTVGKRPRTSGLAPETIGLKLDARGFINVNARLETNVPGVYAIGDVIGGPMLAHKASKEGLTVIECIKDPKAKMDSRALPWAIFVDPEIAVVGHNMESAKAAGWDPVEGKCPFTANGRALTTGDAAGFVKLIADKKTDRLLGAHMVGPEVSNLVAEVAAVIEMGGTSEDLARIIHAHPTLPETIMEAAEAVHSKAIHFFQKKK